MARKKKEIEDKELSLEEAQNVIRKLAHPKHVNQEEKLLKEAAAVVLKETQPEFEFGDEEDDNIKIDSANAAEATSTELTKPPGFLDQLGTTLQALGPAGMIALGSAAYFQIDTVVEETRTVATVAEEKWEEVKFEHPNINWDDPLAGFTTILGMGDIEIDKRNQMNLQQYLKTQELRERQLRRQKFLTNPLRPLKILIMKVIMKTKMKWLTMR